MVEKRKSHQCGDIPDYEQKCLDAIAKVRATRKEYDANFRDEPSHPFPFCDRCDVLMCC